MEQKKRKQSFILVEDHRTCDQTAAKKKKEEKYELVFLLNLTLIEMKNRGLNIKYGVVFSKTTADFIYKNLEREIEYDKISQVKIFGKTFDVPRKQKAYGDDGLTYTFSNVTVPAAPWLPILKQLKDIVSDLLNCNFNFVLVNRYKDGQDYMGEHQDNEKDLDNNAPIASLSLGQNREFVFRHKDLKNGTVKDSTLKHKMMLEHGSLLVMNNPTNDFWYHGLPKRSISTCPNPRINLTFRKMVI
ncbi:DNA oxidative demethylase ALKBH2-like [Clytia hemisphaerica]|uniref:DNA oxidative demethylase ALKBH2-like n=1 Tax=Clytia hemisphaerica TaxID=252671 RepID=UPI0034D4900D